MRACIVRKPHPPSAEKDRLLLHFKHDQALPKDIRGFTESHTFKTGQHRRLSGLLSLVFFLAVAAAFPWIVLGLAVFCVPVTGFLTVVWCFRRLFLTRKHPRADRSRRPSRKAAQLGREFASTTRAVSDSQIFARYNFSNDDRSPKSDPDGALTLDESDEWSSSFPMTPATPFVSPAAGGGITRRVPSLGKPTH